MKEKSYMLALPGEQEPEGRMEVLRRLKNAPDFKVVTAVTEDEGSLEITVEYKGNRYRALLYPTGFELPEFYRCQHLFPDVDIEVMERAESGLAVEMMFGEDALDSYHLQLKLIHAVLPDAVAVLDDSSEKILSGHWVALAAVSSVPPAPRYIYTAQAVSGEEEIVWLHTHGLNRCGISELEVLNSTKDTYNSHYNVLETMANRLLELEEPLEPEEPLYLARLTDRAALVTTLVPWKEAVELYDADMLGGKGDRAEGHNGNTSVIFTYPSKADYEEGNYSPLSHYDEILGNNPIYWISTPETERMKALAVERVSYMLRAMEVKENHILVKVGLTIDEEYQEDNNTKEHIWFELLEAQDGKFTAKLTQEPYYVSGMHQDDIGTYTYDDLTDWIIFTPERRITPDDVYIMDL